MCQSRETQQEKPKPQDEPNSLIMDFLRQLAPMFQGTRPMSVGPDGRPQFPDQSRIEPIQPAPQLARMDHRMEYLPRRVRPDNYRMEEPVQMQQSIREHKEYLPRFEMEEPKYQMKAYPIYEQIQPRYGMRVTPISREMTEDEKRRMGWKANVTPISVPVPPSREEISRNTVPAHKPTNR